MSLFNTLNGNTMPTQPGNPVTVQPGAVQLGQVSYIENPITDRDKTVEQTVSTPQQMPRTKVNGPGTSTSPIYPGVTDVKYDAFSWV